MYTLKVNQSHINQKHKLGVITGWEQHATQTNHIGFQNLQPMLCNTATELPLQVVGWNQTVPLGWPINDNGYEKNNIKQNNVEHKWIETTREEVAGEASQEAMVGGWGMTKGNGRWFSNKGQWGWVRQSKAWGVWAKIGNKTGHQVLESTSKGLFGNQ